MAKNKFGKDKLSVIASGERKERLETEGLIIVKGILSKMEETAMITRDEAFELLKRYNKDPFHIQHALTVEAVMKWYAEECERR